MQYKLGLLDEDTWRASEGIIQNVLSFDWSQRWGELYSEHLSNKELVLHVNEIQEDSMLDYRAFLEQLSNVGAEV